MTRVRHVRSRTSRLHLEALLLATLFSGEPVLRSALCGGPVVMVGTDTTLSELLSPQDYTRHEHCAVHGTCDGGKRRVSDKAGPSLQTHQ